MRQTVLVTALALAAASPLSARAQAQDRDAEIAALRAQLAQLQARIEALETAPEATSPTRAGEASIPAPATAAPVPAAAAAPKVETEGGLKVVSADEAFSFAVGGRIHFDAYAFDRDQAAATGTTEFRRARLTLQGKAYGWDYKFEQDFAAGDVLEGFREVHISRAAFGGKVTIGHFKPYRAMEELTSSNDLLMMERPFASATGLFSGRQFQQGVGYLHAGDHHTAGFSLFNLRNASGTRNEGVGASGRVTYAPIATDDSTLHVGAWASREDLNQGSADISATANYAGRRGPSQDIATTTGASGAQVTAYGIEAAGSFGPLFFQGEYAHASFGQPVGADEDVVTWYLQGSWLLNGGHKAYKSATGVFASPEVGEGGLWELTARYDTIENRDVAALEATAWILGMNYYVNPNLRFMFNYVRGEDAFTGDRTGQYALRTQFTF